MIRAAIHYRISLDRAGAGLGVTSKKDYCRALEHLINLADRHGLATRRRNFGPSVRYFSRIRLSSESHEREGGLFRRPRLVQVSPHDTTCVMGTTLAGRDLFVVVAAVGMTGVVDTVGWDADVAAEPMVVTLLRAVLILTQPFDVTADGVVDEVPAEELSD